jgi:hypothetical protein
MRKGMRFRNDLFEYIAEFNARQRQQVFELTERLAAAGKEVIVTASPSHYTVWVNLRTAQPSASRLSPMPVPASVPVPVPVVLAPSAQELLLLEACMSA